MARAFRSPWAWRDAGQPRDRRRLWRDRGLFRRPGRRIDDALRRYSLFAALHLSRDHPDGRVQPRIFLLFIAIGAVEWLTMARIVRGQTLSIKQKEFIEAARAAGVGQFAIIRRHIIPNVVGPVMVYVTLTIPTVILAESFLSFLGLGMQEPLTSWGVLIQDGTNQMETAPWALIFPALFMAVTLFCFNFIGDGLQRRPRSQGPLGHGQPILRNQRPRRSVRHPDGEVHAVKKVSLDIGGRRMPGRGGRIRLGQEPAFSRGDGLLASNGRATGSVIYRNQELLGLPQAKLNRVRGSSITMIFQDPLTSLTPHMTIGAQIIEALRVHQRVPYGEAERAASKFSISCAFPKPATA
jgi:hypothetical protein